jgi:hypothetical protein
MSERYDIRKFQSMLNVMISGGIARLVAMTYEEMLALIRRLEDRPLRTVTGLEFTVSVYLDSPVFTPASSGLGRSDGRKAAERFLARFNQTDSLRPADYADVTRNASYFVGLFREHR